MKARGLSGSACVHFVFVISRHFSGRFCLNYVTSAGVGARLNNAWARGGRVFIRDRNKKRAESSWRMRFLYNIHWVGKSAGFLFPDRITWSPFYNWHGKNRIWYQRKSGHSGRFSAFLSLLNRVYYVGCVWQTCYAKVFVYSNMYLNDSYNCYCLTSALI